MAGGDINLVTGDQVNKYLTSISIQLQNPEDAENLLGQLKEQLGGRTYLGPPRKLDPMVLVNRTSELSELSGFIEQSSVSVVYIVGLAGIGKSTLVRGALEFRQKDTRAIWVPCEGLDVERLLAQVNGGLQLGLNDVLRNRKASLADKINAVIGMMQDPAIIVLDGLEAMLDDDGAYHSQEMAYLLEALAEYEHSAKVLVTTRRNPRGVGSGSLGVEIMPLGGLSDIMARELLLARAKSVPQPVLSAEAFAKLGGHPKFIELLAGAVAELPAEQVAKGLLSASDIGAFVVNQILDLIDAVDLQILRAAVVFRQPFTFDMLDAVYSAITDGATLPRESIRSLVQRMILEMTEDPQMAYSLHAVLRDAVPREASQEASAHTAAAAWFLREPFDASNLDTWDDGLYHLRLAAETRPTTDYFEPYKEFVFDNDNSLQYAGWGRRLVAEYFHMLPLTDDLAVQYNIKLRLGENLLFLGEYGGAAAIFSERVGVFTELMDLMLESDDQRLPQTLDMLYYSKKRLIEALIGLGISENIEEITKQIADLEALAKTQQDSTESRLDILELRFNMLRRTGGDLEEMYRLADESVALAKQLAKETPTAVNKDKLSEAHFKMGITRLRSGEWEEAQKHFVEQLRIKLEIDKIPGVGFALQNLWLTSTVIEPESAPALFLVGEQIILEVGIIGGWTEKEESEVSQEFLADPTKINLGRAKLESISPGLLPFYQRALERRLAQLDK